MKESYLVSCPPLTYMLKFSGFADLTSCLGWKARSACCSPGLPAGARQPNRTKDALQVACRKSPYALNASGARRHLDTHILDSNPTHRGRRRPLEVYEIDTEAGILSGISRKRSVRSKSYWFTEFCNSQCVSHFAAPFIVVRAETSVAESCDRMKVQKHH